MPSVFLSYAREDEDTAKALEEGLSSQGVSVWRDKAKLHSGERWPKALGEAIASQDFCVLLWSRHANGSSFVDLEWNTAIALKKTVLPCLLDYTELPPALSAIHGIFGTELTQTVSLLMRSLTQAVPPAEEVQTSSLITQLGNIASQDATEVLQQAKGIFQQSNWSVEGSVYQAGRDIHISTTGRRPGKSRLEKATVWVTLVVGSLTIVGLILDLPQKMGIITPDQQFNKTEGEQEVIKVKGYLLVKVENEPADVPYALGVFRGTDFMQKITSKKPIELPVGRYSIRIKHFGDIKTIGDPLETVFITEGQETESTIFIPPYEASIAGQVRIDRLPAGNVTVMATKQNKETCTDDEGNYVLKLKPARDVTLAVIFKPENYDFRVDEARPQWEPTPKTVTIPNHFKITERPKCKT
ncbi:MAG: toll/interleukin-1 receptor domain-containing protein [Nitrospira sp.]|nr:toll/interleukin-1 receptor domain-containing protein [Nitrospira sp.]